MPDFEEMRNAVQRATQDDTVGPPLFRRLMERLNDDIVTRLREQAMEERPLWRSSMIEAANEIEHLRYRVEQMESEREYWQRRAMNPY